MKRMGRKRIASALLALVMVLALLPVSLMASASEILADVLTADPPGVSVSWKAGEIIAGEQGVVHLSAALDPEQVTEASVTIQLEEAEANALQAESLAGGPSYSVEEKSLSFTLNSEASSLDADLVFLYPSGQENDFTVDVDVTDDISVIYTAVPSPDGLPDGSEDPDTDTDVEPSPAPGNEGEDEPDSTQEVRPQIQITAEPLTISAPAPTETDDGAQKPQNDPAGSGDPAPDETLGDWTVAVSSEDKSVLTVTEGEDGTTAYTVQDFSFTAVMMPPTVGEGKAVPPLSEINLSLTLPEGLTLPSSEEGAGTYTFDSTTKEIVYTSASDGSDPAEPIKVAVLNGIPEGMTVNNINYWSDARHLTISVGLSEGTENTAAVTSETTVSAQFYGAAFDVDGEQIASDSTKTVTFLAQVFYNTGTSASAVTGEATLPLLSQEEPEPEPEPNEIIITDSREEGFFQTVVWADNNNADTSRPTTAVYQGNDLLWFSIGGREWVPLTQETMAQVGLTEVPLSVTPSGTNYTVSVEGNTLPSHISVNGISYGVDWQLRQPEVEDYLIHTPEDTGDTDWYYVKETDFTITINLRSGDDPVLTEEELQALLVERFMLYFHYGDTYSTESLERILEQHGGQVALEATEDGAYRLSVTGLRAYTTDNQPIEYSFAPTFSSVVNLGRPDMEYIIPTTLEGIEGLEEGDSLSLSYTNAQTPNHGTDTDRAYNDGTLTLTLSGSTSYSAHKQWLDTYTNQEAEGGSGSTGGDAGEPAETANPENDKLTARPAVEYELWRYVAGQSYLSAAPVRDSDGNIMTLKGDKLQTQDSYSIEFGLNDDDLETLPKYDQDGNRYIYVVREYLTYGPGGSRYNQVFGTVDGDNNITQDSLPDGADEATEGEHDRQSGDTFLYNEKDGTAGTTYTLSNQVTTQVTVTGTKEWKASAYQADLSHIEVTMTLQAAVADTENTAQKADTSSWYNVTDENGETVQVSVSGFSSVVMSKEFSAGANKYDAQGRELVFRWIETDVTAGEGTGVTIVEGSKTYEDDKLTGFTVRHSDGREVTYHVEHSDDGKTVTNAIAGEIDYHVEKVWVEPDDYPPTAVSFSIYRVVAGGSLTDEPLLTFYFDAKGVLDRTQGVNGITFNNKANPGLTEEEKAAISLIADEGGDWSAVVKNLPEYDENGRRYEYVLLENTEGTTYAPTYETTVDPEGNYTTVVTNGPGGGDRVMVHKDWLDDSDTIHRQPVILQAFSRTLENGNLVPASDPICLMGPGVTGDTDTQATALPTEWPKEYHYGGALANTGSVVYAWNALLGLKEEQTRDNVIVLETYMWSGDEWVPVDNTDIKTAAAGANVNWSSIFHSATEFTAGEDFVTSKEFQTDYHRYVARYENPEAIGGEQLYTVTNRRLGSVNVTVTKEWMDGEENGQSEKRKELIAALNTLYGETGTNLVLAIQLQFQESSVPGDETPKITQTAAPIAAKTQNPDNYKGDTVSLGNPATTTTIQRPNPTSNSGADPDRDTVNAPSQQIVLSKDGSSDAAYFWNLPKYNLDGSTVRYEVREVWLAKDSTSSTYTEVHDLSTAYSEIYALYQEYQTSIREVSYTAGGADNQGEQQDGAPDDQQIAVTNRLTGTKDVRWYKEWKDAYNLEHNLRPDLYLDIYRVVHRTVEQADGTTTVKTAVQLVEQNYRWTPTVEPGGSTEAGVINSDTYWTVTLQNLEKYDSLGYEIEYFAVERSMVTAGDYDYQPVEYYSVNTANPDSPVYTYIGSRESLAGEPEDGTGGPEATSEDYVLDLKDYGSYLDANGREQTIGDAENLAKYFYPTTGESSATNYALKEGCVFRNTIQDQVTINGLKVWEQLPSGYPAANLPTVTFHLYQKLDGEKVSPDLTTGRGYAVLGADSKYYATPNGNEVATLTLAGEDWKALSQADQGSSYFFQIQYLGTNIYENGEWSGSYKPDADSKPQPNVPLPKYDGDGNLYSYTLVEVTPDDIGGQEVGNVYSDWGTMNTYTATNVYDSVKGAVSVKKYLYLESDDGAPVVTMQLNREYQGNGGTVDDSWSQTIRWTPSANELEGWNDAGTPIKHTFTFENLPIYAPNGSKYTYSVTEVRTQLLDYDTWAEKENLNEDSILTTETKHEGNGTPVTIDELQLTPYEDKSGNPLTSSEGNVQTIAIAATFANRREPDNGREKITLSVTKNWDDWNDALDLRPDAETFAESLELYRWTKTPAGGTAITKEAVEGAVFVPGTDPNQWTFQIKIGGSTELEKNAPNGMPWIYSVKETLTGTEYAAIPSNGEVTLTINGASGSGTLKNTLMTSVPFQKQWVDQEGNAINVDFLGLNLKVTFELQVKGTDGTWTDAKTYLTKNLTSEQLTTLGLTNYPFTQTLGGDEGWTVDSTEWNTAQSFQNLPRAIKVGEGTVTLQYRVVETSVQYRASDSNEPDGWTRIPINPGTGDNPYASFDSNDNILIDGITFTSTSSNNLTKNQLDVGSITVTKIWNDHSNAYNTRPTFEEELGTYQWQVDFLIQRTTDDPTVEDAAWTTVYDADGDPLIVSIVGMDTEDRGTYTISGLPLSGAEGAYTYRARELRPNYDAADPERAIVEDGANYNNSYEASYADNTSVTNSIAGVEEETITITAEKKWWSDGADGAVTEEAPDGATVTLELQYSLDGGQSWQSFATPAQVTLDGVDPNDPGEVQKSPYRVMRLVLLNDSGEEQEVAYSKTGAWSAQWTGLPARLPGQTGEGNTRYQVVEVLVDASNHVLESVTENGYAFTLANVQKTSLTVSKVWHGFTAPGTSSITVGLFRTVEDSTEPVTGTDGMQKTAVLNAGNKWSATFSDLPKYNADGDLYRYSVKELKQGTNDEYLEADAIQSVDDGAGGTTQWLVHYIPNADGSSMTVANIATLSISGTKTWVDNGNNYNTRPENLELTLKRSTDNGTTWTEVEGVDPTWENKETDQWTYRYDNLPATDDSGNPYTYTVKETVPGDYTMTSADKTSGGVDFTNTLTGEDSVSISGTKTWVDKDNAGNTRPDSITVILYANGVETQRKTVTASDNWSYTFTGLDKYDSKQNFITYTVQEETVPGGYDESYDGHNITNTLKGSLKVEKILHGNNTESDRNFTFTVTLGEPLNGTFDGVTFTGGVASFTLKGGESKTITGLPGNISYTVTEQEAGQDGYSTSSTGSTGTIPPGGTAEAVFTNSRSSDDGGDDDITVSGNKIWRDNNDAEGLRPDTLILTLYRQAGDGPVETVHQNPILTGKSGNTWHYSFQGLPERDSHGTRYTYWVEETVPDGYEVTYDGDDIINSLTPDPDDPGTPDEPGDPGEPDSPGDPDEPGSPDEPGNPDEPDGPDIPKTGDTSRIALYGAVLAASLTGLAVLLLHNPFRKRGKRERR